MFILVRLEGHVVSQHGHLRHHPKVKHNFLIWAILKTFFFTILSSFSSSLFAEPLASYFYSLFLQLFKWVEGMTQVYQGHFHNTPISDSDDQIAFGLMALIKLAIGLRKIPLEEPIKQSDTRHLNKRGSAIWSCNYKT